MASKYAKLLSSVAIGAVLALSACDQQAPQKTEKVEVEVKQNAAEQIAPYQIPTTQSLAGNYVAARFAIANDDLSSASTFFTRAIDLDDPKSDFLTERALPAAIGAGDFKTALELTKSIDLKKPTATSQLAVTVLLVDAFKKGNNDQIAELMPMMRMDGFGRLLRPLLDVWAKIGKDDVKTALADLDKLQKEHPSLAPLVDMHKALVYDYADDKEKAEEYYAKGLDNHFSVRSAYMVGQFYERQKDMDKVVKMYADLTKKLPGSVLPILVFDRLDKGQLKTESFIKEPKDGVAAALYDVATVLHQEGSSRLAILYAQMAHYLAPQDDFTIMLLGDILSDSAVPDQAMRYFESIPKDSDLAVLAQLRMAQIYERMKDGDKSVSILQNLENNKLIRRQVLNEMGDIYRMREEFTRAIPFYTEIINSIKKPNEGDWVLFYARGICYERTGEWKKAEDDLKIALTLSPSQPEVLNYLAYSWADHGQNLPQALSMLEKALSGAPDDPYITDSVGWALFKTGRYQDALPFLEVAAQYLPDDPTINDHLGDLYWVLDRRLEAQFQWERALKFVSKKDDVMKSRLQEKLDVGLTKDEVKTSSKD